MLEKYLHDAVLSFRNTSFDSDKRGKQLIEEFSKDLQTDVDNLKEHGIDPEAYITKYQQLFSSWLNAKKNTYSVMITGPANFNPSRHQKRNNAERNAYERFVEVTKKMHDGLIKAKNKAEYTTESEIDRLRGELDKANRVQEKMKQLNAIYPKYLKNPNCILDMDLTKAEIECITGHVPDWATKTKIFATFQLTNNNARIKGMVARIAQLEELEANKKKEAQVVAFDGGEVVLDYELNRIQIKHDVKPNADVMAKLKSGGFRWSPSNGAWQLPITNHAKYKVSQITGVEYDALKS